VRYQSQVPTEKPYLGPDEQDMVRLDALLRRLGATEDDLAAGGMAGSQRSGGDLALELALRTGPPVPIADVARRLDTSSEEFARFWRALGFPAPGPEATIPADIVEALPVVTQATSEWLGEDVALGISRVVGAATARLAEALVDAFRMQFEVPHLTAGTSYSDVVEEYVGITRDALPAFESFVVSVLRAHLVRVASGTWTPDVEQSATRRDLLVAFVDLAGYTALARTLSPRELAQLLDRFEEAVSDVVSRHGGRVVKLIGDGAMVVVDTAEGGCAALLELSARIEATDGLPPARIGADHGTVLSLYGDYFGDVVNRAARLVALARPATIVVTDTVAAICRNSFGCEQLPPQALKGFGAPAVTYRLVAR
jgi:adenylate cyclase